jgi:murein DD-endopeptidase MepM/ murein hydrolase activator NlpD
MDPGTYPLTLQILPEAGGAVVFEFPLQVVVGRYGYERIDPIAGQQALFDPVLLQGERDKLDAIAVTYRTPERYWQLPFAFPVNAAISSYFGSRRSYGGSYDSYHAGVDFRASTGTPARASQPGIVILAETLPVRGNAVMVDHGWGVLTGYWHLSRIDVQVGQYVEQGQAVGLVGSTGLSTGSHLHWEMWVDGRPIDPLQWVETFYEFSDPALLPVTEFVEE